MVNIPLFTWFYAPQGGCLGFLNHQQYPWQIVMNVELECHNDDCRFFTILDEHVDVGCWG